MPDFENTDALTLDDLLQLKSQQEPPEVVCLCGSTRFYSLFKEVGLKLALAGKIVHTIGIDLKSDADLLLAGEITPEHKVWLDVLHLWKIEKAHRVIIINPGGKIGPSTRRELEYALRLGKVIEWWEEPSPEIMSTIL